eukprot:Blabericola_migrator_1__2738@NODE_1780_length_3808_cov_52_340551_g1146_i0_p1_GENE_NODE_1780_length_3808_cov_52_340551_g1146_i0NODE_1780_length_3808_cov_52_340551_g1146_i0_p1_ORF_typecomplete_len594_score83_89DUF982/PF06169_12/1_8e04DUF982/PF06169_12/0_46_NODE_1780_length_3808_cov_52_340551_g1146_i018983679
MLPGSKVQIVKMRGVIAQPLSNRVSAIESFAICVVAGPILQGDVSQETAPENSVRAPLADIIMNEENAQVPAGEVLHELLLQQNPASSAQEAEGSAIPDVQAKKRAAQCPLNSLFEEQPYVDHQMKRSLQSEICGNDSNEEDQTPIDQEVPVAEPSWVMVVDASELEHLNIANLVKDVFTSGAIEYVLHDNPDAVQEVGTSANLTPETEVYVPTSKKADHQEVSTYEIRFSQEDEKAFLSILPDAASEAGMTALEQGDSLIEGEFSISELLSGSPDWQEVSTTPFDDTSTTVSGDGERTGASHLCEIGSEDNHTDICDGLSVQEQDPVESTNIVQPPVFRMSSDTPGPSLQSSILQSSELNENMLQCRHQLLEAKFNQFEFNWSTVPVGSQCVFELYKSLANERITENMSNLVFLRFWESPSFDPNLLLHWSEVTENIAASTADESVRLICDWLLLMVMMPQVSSIYGAARKHLQKQGETFLNAADDRLHSLLQSYEGLDEAIKIEVRRKQDLREVMEGLETGQQDWTSIVLTLPPIFKRPECGQFLEAVEQLTEKFQDRSSRWVKAQQMCLLRLITTAGNIAQAVESLKSRK